MPHERLLLPCLAVFLACTRSPTAPPARPMSRTFAAPARADASVDAGDETPPAPPSLAAVVALVRDGDRSAARAALERLPSSVQRTPEARFVLAKLALDDGDGRTALRAVDGLAALLPALDVDVRRIEAAALASAGRHAEARVAFDALAARGGGARDRTHAVLEAWAAGDHRQPLESMRSWVAHPPAAIDRSRAWGLAAEALDESGEGVLALEARRRLAVDEPDTAAGQRALAALQQAGHPLTTASALERVATLLERARHAEAIEALTAIPAARGRDETRRVHLWGRATFGARTRYVEAHRWLTLASQDPANPDREEDAFLAARALSRADRDDEAVRAYDAVAMRSRGRWADEAAFRAAWLASRHARVDDAVRRWNAFLRDRPDAAAHLRVDAAWHLGWTLYGAGRFAEAIEPLARSGDWATHHLERGRGRYWSGVCRARTGDAAGAVQAWRALDAHRPLTWYALLAEARIGAQGGTVEPLAAPPEARPRPPVPLPARVRWLAVLGFDREAADVLAADEDRLRASLPRDRADESLAGAYLALGDARRAFVLASHHADALDALPDATTRWVWDASFPRPLPAQVAASETRNALPRDYLYAIMRQESGFNGRDVSSARAIGLLQMVPPTTRRVAAELGIPFTEDRLFEPAYNIVVGGHYIGRLFRQYRGVLPRAIGSYNAGPGAMNRWLREHGADEADAFVEAIPFDETRTYVRRVVQNLARYRYLRGAGEAPLTLPLRNDPGVDEIVDY